MSSHNEMDLEYAVDLIFVIEQSRNGLTWDQIGDTMGLEGNTVRSRYNRAKKAVARAAKKEIKDGSTPVPTEHVQA